MAADLVILTNQGATPGGRELAAAFSRASGHNVTVIQADDAILQQRLDDGTADLITGNPGPIEELVRNGKVVAGTVTPFVRAGLGLSVRAGAPKPDISTVEAYKATLLAAKSIGYSRGCSGTNVGEGIAQVGLTEQLKDKTIFTTSGPVTDYVARGDFEIGIQQTNIMVGVPEGAGGRARNDPVHDFAGGRAAAPQNLRGTLPPLRPAFRRDKFFDCASAVSPGTAFRGSAWQAPKTFFTLSGSLALRAAAAGGDPTAEIPFQTLLFRAKKGDILDPPKGGINGPCSGTSKDETPRGSGGTVHTLHSR